MIKVELTTSKSPGRENPNRQYCDRCGEDLSGYPIIYAYDHRWYCSEHCLKERWFEDEGEYYETKNPYYIDWCGEVEANEKKS